MAAGAADRLKRAGLRMVHPALGLAALGALFHLWNDRTMTVTAYDLTCSIAHTLS